MGTVSAFEYLYTANCVLLYMQLFGSAFFSSPECDAVTGALLRENQKDLFVYSG